MQNRASFRRMQRSRWSQSVTFSSGNLGEMVQPGIPTFTMFSEISFLFFLFLNVLRCQCFLKFLFSLYTFPFSHNSKIGQHSSFSKVLHPTFLMFSEISPFFNVPVPTFPMFSEIKAKWLHFAGLLIEWVCRGEKTLSFEQQFSQKTIDDQEFESEDWQFTIKKKQPTCSLSEFAEEKNLCLSISSSHKRQLTTKFKLKINNLQLTIGHWQYTIRKKQPLCSLCLEDNWQPTIEIDNTQYPISTQKHHHHHCHHHFHVAAI